MSLLIISFLAGALTIVSPCILPLLPFALSRVGQPFYRGVLPMLISLASTFALVGTLAAGGGSWVIGANAFGRGVALIVFAVFGISLISSRLATSLAYPFVALGNRILVTNSSGQQGVLAGLLAGIATGLLWTPCAGPVLGLILTGAALNGASTHTAVLLCAYASGAALSIAAVIGTSSKVLTWFRARGLQVERLRQCIGVAVLVSVGAIILAWDTGLLATLSFSDTSAVEERLLHGSKAVVQPPSKPVPRRNDEHGTLQPASFGHQSGRDQLSSEGNAGSLQGAIGWLNASPETAKQLQGKVVLVDFWTYSCINCIRTLPYLRAWDQKYRSQGLVIIGVHTPEFAFEKRVDNVQAAVRSFKLEYPVAIDSDYRIWRAFHNQYWPAMYFVDRSGHIKHHVFGEGDYARSEQVIQQMLSVSAGAPISLNGSLQVDAVGVEAPSDTLKVRSPETYLGYAQADRFASPGGIQADHEANYTAGRPRINEWAFSGKWNVGSDVAMVTKPGAHIIYRFHARDLHLVLGTSKGNPVRYRITLDGNRPGPDHGADTNAEGEGVITRTRLYQLVRQTSDVRDRTFEIEFLDSGAQAFAFTFG